MNKFYPFLLLLFWPLLWIISRLIRPFKIGIRNGKKGLYVPSVMLAHPNKDYHVFLAGTIHIGQKEYFESLSHDIEYSQLLGHKILYEGIGPADASKRMNLNKSELDLLEQFESLSEFYEYIKNISDLSFQKDCIEYRDEWIRTDSDVLTIAKKLASKKGIVNKFIDIEKLKSIDKNIFKFLIHRMIRSFEVLMTGAMILKIFDRSLRNKDAVILNYRNKIASDSIIKESANSDVFSIWGAAHLPGIIKNLERAGFKLIGKTWDLAYYNSAHNMRELYDKISFNNIH